MADENEGAGSSVGLADVTRAYTRGRRLGLWMGPMIFASMLMLPAPEGLSVEGWRVAAVAVLMAVWWISEALPIAVTALVPIGVLPLLGARTIGEATDAFGNPLLFLFIGGFLIAEAMQRWNLHRRIALILLSFVGDRASAIVGGFMLATGFLSMWVSNTATTAMMLPVGLSVILLVSGGASGTAGQGDKSFATALMLSIAYSASIGGMATLVGTPTNALLAAYLLETSGYDLGFAEWLLVGLPLSAIMMVITWLALTRFLIPVSDMRLPLGAQMLADELKTMGRMSRGERWTALVFVLVAVAWIMRPLISSWLPGANISDAGIAIAGGLLLFIAPVNLRAGEFVLDAEAVGRLPWSVVVLLGGGLCLASAIGGSGLAAWIGSGFEAFGNLPLFVAVAAVVAIVILLTELTSNVATTAAFLPIVSALALGMGVDAISLCAPLTLAASCAFMMPVATPPNAIVFGSGHLTIAQMARAGIWLNIIGLGLISVLGLALVNAVFGGSGVG